MNAVFAQGHGRQLSSCSQTQEQGTDLICTTWRAWEAVVDPGLSEGKFKEYKLKSVTQARRWGMMSFNDKKYSPWLDKSLPDGVNVGLAFGCP